MPKRYIARLLKQSIEILANKRNEFYISRISKKHNMSIGQSFAINGIPSIDIWHDSSLSVGHNVLLNSSNKGYHINMHSPVKLLADRANARIIIGNNTRIHGTCIHAFELVEIGDNCLIAANCHIFDGNGHDLSFPDVENRINTFGSCRPVTIENNVWIGANSFILPGVTIGEGSVISANSVVTKSIPKMVVAGGNPAIIIKKYESKTIDK